MNPIIKFIKRCYYSKDNINILNTLFIDLDLNVKSWALPLHIYYNEIYDYLDLQFLLLSFTLYTKNSWLYAIKSDKEWK